MRARYAHTRVHSAEKKHFCTTLRYYYSFSYSRSSPARRDRRNRPIRGHETAERWPPCAHAARARARLCRQRVMGQGRRHASVWGRLGTDPSMGHQTWGGLRVGILGVPRPMEAGDGVRRCVRSARVQSTHLHASLPLTGRHAAKKYGHPT